MVAAVVILILIMSIGTVSIAGCRYIQYKRSCELIGGCVMAKPVNNLPLNGPETNYISNAIYDVNEMGSVSSPHEDPVLKELHNDIYALAKMEDPAEYEVPRCEKRQECGIKTVENSMYAAVEANYVM